MINIEKLPQKLDVLTRERERERESKRLRGFIKFLFSFVFALTLFFTVHSSVYAATLRWAQVDKGVVSHAYKGGAMMVQKDKITANNYVFGTSRFDGTKWDDAGTPSPKNIGGMFLDSRGIIYIGGQKTDDNLSYIFESTDGLNFTPVQLFVDSAGGGYVWNFSEDKYGNVWAGEYTSGASSTGAHLWRRRPNGTWTNVANWAKPEDHIHQVYYDPFRDALYVAIGDQDHGILKLPSNKINADGISSADFSFILPTGSDGKGVEVTAMTSDSSYIYVGLDSHAVTHTNSRSIARITDNGAAPSMEYVYPLAKCGLSEWAHVDENGVIIFFLSGETSGDVTCTSGNLINKVLASDDHGTTWQTIKDYGNTTTTAGSNGEVGLPSYYATNWSGLYGFGQGQGAISLRGTIGRVIPANSTFYVDGTSGVDWTNFGITQARPVKTLNYLELLDVQSGDTVSFIGTNTYAYPLIAGWSGNSINKILLRGNTTSTFSGGNLANTPAVAETFESAKGSWNFTLNEAGGSITADTSIFHEGLQSAKVVRGASGTTSMMLKNVVATNINEGDTMYTSYWFYYPSDQTASSDLTMFRMLDNSNYELRLDLRSASTSFMQNEIVLNTPQTSNWAIPSRKSLTSGTWHKMYIEDYLHSTNGSFKMYIDNQLWLNVNGIKTVTAGGKMGSIYFFPYLNPITFYIDDFKFGKLPFDNQGAINTNDYNYLDIGNFKIQGINGALLSSNTTNIDLHDSIFNGLTNDAIISSGSANLNFYYNTIFGSGRYGFNAVTNATLENNVVYNSTTNDVFIGGATLTGNNNWFKDLAKGGTGTYTDVGSTTWSGANPTFANSGTGDFHLLSTSPLINAGINITGFTSDFVGTVRPQGIAPDIGAYEFLVPSSPTFLAQYQSDGTSSITSGGTLGNNSTVVLKFSMSSTNASDSLTPQVEVEHQGIAFTNTPTNSGNVVNFSGTAVTGTVTIPSVGGGNYHWQARVSNAAGQSSWVSMGGNPDFSVEFLPSSPPSCSDQAPVGKAPWLYGAIANSANTINLNFTNWSNPVDHYTLEYGTKSNSYQFGSDNIGGNGTNSYIVNSLNPNTTYYFRVRSGNGCATGPWSNEMSARTLGFVSSNQQITQSELETQPTTALECQTYTIKSGDSLWSIAITLLGDGNKYKDIISQNKDQYPSLESSNNIEAGWELKVNCGENNKQDLQKSPSNEDTAGNGVVDINKKPVEGSKVTPQVIGIIGISILILSFLGFKLMKKNKIKKLL